MWHFLLRQLPGTALRLSAAFAIYALLNMVPWPANLAHWIGATSFAALAVVALVICGKLLYDTLFFERYWRQMDSR
ncbi:MAG: hypothetical protein HY332_24135 [Chloroflexi bacterium]|nr:hypothetical protein [Chloroflexota bacterium]